MQMQTSRLHGMSRFAETISCPWKRAGALRKAFEQSAENTPAMQAVVAELRALALWLATGAEFSPYSESRGHGFSLEHTIAR